MNRLVKNAIIALYSLILMALSTGFAFGQHKLPELPYKYNALEPYIDSTTMLIHHTGHHQAYVNNLNKALEKYPQYHSWSVDELLLKLNSLPQEIQTAVRNNGGGHYNHTLFWEIMGPAESTTMSPALESAIIQYFGSIDRFKEEFEKAAVGRFGSGWVWLLKKREWNSLYRVYSQSGQYADALLQIGGYSNPRFGCLGACLLPEISIQKRWIRKSILECSKLE